MTDYGPPTEGVTTPPTTFRERYPHGVLVEQEGGVPNDVYDWESATHICRKHRKREAVCRDA